MSSHPTNVSLSIVMPVRNGAATIADQLRAIERAEKPDVQLEVVIADNGSSDDTQQIASSYSDCLPLRVIDASRAPGINVARNCGVRSSRGRWILLCDCDDEVDEGWIVRMVEAFSSGSRAVGGPIDYSRLNTPEARQWRGASGATVQQQVDFLPSAHGANCGFTRELFDLVGGFDESFLNGGDDTDFFWRAQLAGSQLDVVHAAIVHYRLRSTLKGVWAQFVGYGASEVRLYRAFADRGLRRRSTRSVFRDVWWLLSRAPFAVPRARRGAWLRVLGSEWGRVRESIRTRTLWL